MAKPGQRQLLGPNTSAVGRRGLAYLHRVAGTGERQAAAKRPPMYHMTANHQITFIDKDHARIDAYHITGVAGAGRETPPRLAGIGRSIDELGRVNGQWLIKSRNVAPMD